MIESYIIDLLRTNDCVIVPGFGGFLTHKQPAKILAQQREITPPGTGIIFNRSLDRNDGLLSHFLANKTRETFKKAQSIIDETVSSWKKSLEQDKSLEIAGIGRFSLNEENKWQFAPIEAGLQFHNSFGLTNVQLYMADKAEQKTLKLASHDEREIKTRKISRGWVYGGLAAAAVTILAFFIAPQVQTFLKPAQNVASTAKIAPAITEAPRQTIENNSFIAAASALKPGTTIETPQPSIANNTFLAAVAAMPEKPAPNPTETQAAQPVPETASAPVNNENTASVNASQGSYYVIGGSFLVQKNAKKFARQLEKKGYKSQIIHNSNGFFNVSIVKEADSTSAAQQLNKLKIQENQQAWILKW